MAWSFTDEQVKIVETNGLTLVQVSAVLDAFPGLTLEDAIGDLMSLKAKAQPVPPASPDAPQQVAPVPGEGSDPPPQPESVE